jgi:hypothetical protein
MEEGLAITRINAAAAEQSAIRQELRKVPDQQLAPSTRSSGFS